MFGYEPEYIDCGDARIACYDIGRGHPLILLHGNGEDSSYWNAQISEFTRFMRVIAVDSRGHGASDSGTKGLSFDLMARDLKHILDVKGIKKAFSSAFRMAETLQSSLRCNGRTWSGNSCSTAQMWKCSSALSRMYS